MQVMFNGELIDESDAVVSVRDRGFMYGEGAFETVAIYGGRPFRLGAHLDRLMASLQSLRIAPAVGITVLVEQVAKLIDANRLTSGLVRISHTRGIGARGPSMHGATAPVVLLTAHPAFALPASVPVVVSEVRRVPTTCLPAHAKHANYLNSILAYASASDAGAAEALMLSVEGHLAEGTFSNLFFVRAGQLCTPALSVGILPGITRAVVLDLAAEMGVPIQDGRFDPTALDDADEVFLTNTSWGVMPVNRLGDRCWGGAGPLTAQLQRAYWEAAAREAGPSWATEV